MQSVIVMEDDTANLSQPTHAAKLRSFARRHPVVTALGLGGAMLAAPELAVGIVIGVGLSVAGSRRSQGGARAQ